MADQKLRDKVANILYGELTYQNYLALPEMRRRVDLVLDQILTLILVDTTAEIKKDSQITSDEQIEMAKAEEGWELQDKLLGMTVLNQNTPKIVLTNDECGWYISYYPNPPRNEGEISLLRGNPLEVVQALWQVLRSKEG